MLNTRLSRCAQVLAAWHSAGVFTSAFAPSHRGKQIARGAGCTKIGYHGRAYRLDGRLEQLPDQYGFPNLDKSTHGLVPVVVAVKGGIVFVTQGPQLGNGALEQLPELLPPNLEIFFSDDSINDINWKLNLDKMQAS